MSGIHRGTVYQQIDRLYRDGTLAGLDDAQLLERYLTERDEAAFETLVNLHGPMVLGVCRRVLRDPKDIEDAFQATFLVLVRKAPAIRDRELLANWLYGVAFRVASRTRSNLLRRRDREVGIANLEAPVDAESTDLAELGPVLDRELNRLPHKYRSALVSCYLGCQTHEQAARALRCPVGTVRSRLARGRDMLKTRLTRLGYAPSAAVFGPAAGVPGRLLMETVPPALVSATVRAGLAIGSNQTFQTGAVAASVLALTQGALTTMKLAQLKWIALATLTTTFSAGGVIAVCYASAQAPQQKGAPAVEAQPGVVATPVPAQRPDVAEKAAPTGADANRDTGAGTLTQPSIRAIEAQLKVRLMTLERLHGLLKQSSISQNIFDEEQGKALHLVGILEGLRDDFNDESDRLALEKNKKQAELDQAKAHREGFAARVARNQRLNARKAGIIGEDDIAQADAEFKEAEAQVQVKTIDVQLVELRQRQLRRRLDLVDRALKLAVPLKTDQGRR
jgi:RNA polymerase sigma factor (sigma-70 family)